MLYEEIADITNMRDIPLNKKVTVIGRVNSYGWMWHMKGIFKVRDDNVVFEDINGVIKKVEDGEIDLVILRKIESA